MCKGDQRKKMHQVVAEENKEDGFKAACEEFEVCRRYTSHNTKEPLQNVKIQDFPSQILSQDIFTFKEHDYMLPIDQCSDFIEVDVLPNTTADTVVKCTVQHLHLSKFCLRCF